MKKIIFLFLFTLVTNCYASHIEGTIKKGYYFSIFTIPLKTMLDHFPADTYIGEYVTAYDLTSPEKKYEDSLKVTFYVTLELVSYSEKTKEFEFKIKTGNNITVFARGIASDRLTGKIKFAKTNSDIMTMKGTLQNIPFVPYKGFSVPFFAREDFMLNTVPPELFLVAQHDIKVVIDAK